MVAYLAAALVFVAVVAGAGWKGYQAGGDRVRAEYAEEKENARKDAEERENWNRLLARGEAKNLQVALGRQKELSRDLGTALEAHIRAMPAPPAGCPAATLSDGLLDAWNAANRGADAAGRSLPTGSRPTPPAAGTVPSSRDQEPR